MPGGSTRGAIIALEGPSGVGKSTVTRELAERLGASYLAEAWARLRPAPSLRYRSRSELLTLERRLLAEESRRFRQARRLALRGRPVIADTGFLGPLTYSAGLARLPKEFDVVRPLVGESVRRMAGGGLGAADLTFYLDATPPTLRTRQQGARGNHPEDLARRHERVADYERGIWVTFGAARMIYAEGSPRRVATTIARSVPPRVVPSRHGEVADPAVVRALEISTALLVSGASETLGGRRPSFAELRAG